MSTPPAHPPRLLDKIGLLGFLLLWLLPVTYHGLTGLRPMPFMPRRLLHLTNISCLFTRAVPSWPFEYLQVLPQRDGAWETLRESDYFEMPVFGNRTRLSELTRSELAPQAFYELAVWVQSRYAQRHGRLPVAVRVLRTFYTEGRDLPAGRWTQPPLAAVPEEARDVVFTFYPGQKTLPSEELPAVPGPAAPLIPSPR